MIDKMVLYSLLVGSLVMKSTAIVSNGSASSFVVIGYRGGLGCVVHGLVD